MPLSPTATPPGSCTIQFDWNAGLTAKTTIGEVDSPRRTFEGARPAAGANLGGAAVGQPFSPRRQAQAVDASLLTMNRSLETVVASNALRRQVADHHVAAGNPASQAPVLSIPAAKFYAPFVSHSQVTTWYDAASNRISVGIPGDDGTSAEIWMHLAPDGKSVTGLEKYTWSEPEEVVGEVWDALTDAGVMKLVSLDGERRWEISERFLNGEGHPLNVADVPTVVQYDPHRHQLRVTASHRDDCEFRITLDRQSRGKGCTAVSVDNHTRSGPQHVPTETLETLVAQGILDRSLLDIRLASSHTPRAVARLSEPEPVPTQQPNAAKPQPARRVPSPVNSLQKPAPLDLPVANVIANTTLLKKIRGAQHAGRRFSWGSPSVAAQGQSKEVVDIGPLRCEYDASLALIWVKAGADPDATPIRIKLSLDRKTVLRIDELKPGLTPVSEGALATLIEAGLMRPEVMQSLYPGASHVEAPGTESLRSPEPRIRLQAALGVALYGTALPSSETQAQRVQQWTDFLLDKIEIADQAGEAAVIDLRGIHGKSQTDALAALGPVGWRALLDHAKELGATKLVPLVQGRNAVELINIATAATPDMDAPSCGRVMVLTDASRSTWKA